MCSSAAEWDYASAGRGDVDSSSNSVSAVESP